MVMIVMLIVFVFRLGGDILQGADARSEGCDLGFGLFLADAGAGGHFADGVQVFAADEIERGEGFVDAAADHGVEFFAGAGQRGKGPTGDTSDIVEEARTVWHVVVSFLGSSKVGEYSSPG